VLAFRARPDHQLEIGARFRPVGDTAFGKPSRSVWYVKDVFDATDGKVHARLIDSLDSANCKTVSVSALLHSGLYQRAR
jgi:hypothetical protein